MQCLADTKRWALLLTEKCCKATFFITCLCCWTCVPVRLLPAKTAGATRLKSSISNILSWPPWTSESNKAVFSSMIKKSKQISFVNSKRQWALNEAVWKLDNAKSVSHSTQKTCFWSVWSVIASQKLIIISKSSPCWCSEAPFIRSPEKLAGHLRTSKIVKWQA